MVVEKGDKIYVDADNLTSTSIRIRWVQQFIERSVDFYMVEFVDKDRSDEKGVLFIQEDYLQSFQNKSSGGDNLVTVDENFQWGSNGGNTMRFLVFHNKENRMYMSRFISNAVETIKHRRLKNFANDALKEYYNVSEGILQALFGDRLRNF